MPRLKPITIIGGGLAGLTLGIGLRRLNVPVTVREAGHYPRHRVCGEFISGRGVDVLRRLELLEQFQRAGVSLARKAAFFLNKAQAPIHVLEPPALCLSRFTLDQLLAERFRKEGGDLRENSRVEDELGSEGVVCAKGRRLQAMDHGWRWFGLKVHAREVDLEADLEMHAAERGYVGLCRLPGGEVNVCGLFRNRPGTTPPPARQLLRGDSGTALNNRIGNALFDESSFCAVAGISLQPQHARGALECRLGDALTMIPPVTGNGMSMAFEAAEIAIRPLAEYARGDLSWSEACRMTASACDTNFRQRLFWAKWLQAMMFSSAVRGRFGTLLLNSNLVWQMVFARTR